MVPENRQDWLRACAVDVNDMPGASAADLERCAKALWSRLELGRITKLLKLEMHTVEYTDGRPASHVIFVDETLARHCPQNLARVHEIVTSYVAGWWAGVREERELKI